MPARIADLRRGGGLRRPAAIRPELLRAQHLGRVHARGTARGPVALTSKSSAPSTCPIDNAPSSPAEAAGWKAGEEMVAIDGKPLGLDASNQARSSWRYRASGQTVVLTVKGEQRRLTLRDDY